MPARVLLCPQGLQLASWVTMHQTMFKCASEVPMLGGTCLGGGTCTFKGKGGWGGCVGHYVLKGWHCLGRGGLGWCGLALRCLGFKCYLVVTGSNVF